MVVNKFVTILDFFQKQLIEVKFLDTFKAFDGYWSYFGYNFTLHL